jgi:hypothetical protein
MVSEAAPKKVSIIKYNNPKFIPLAGKNFSLLAGLAGK